MLNDHLAYDEAKKINEQRIKEAEDYSQQRQLGFNNSRTIGWVFLLIVVIGLVVAGLLL